MKKEATLFNSYQLLLVNNGTASGYVEEVQKVISRVGFTRTIHKEGKTLHLPEGMYAGFFEGQDSKEVLDDLEREIHNLCEAENISVFTFVITDVSESEFRISTWHDGFY